MKQQFYAGSQVMWVFLVMKKAHTAAGLILSVQSNQFVQSEMQFVQSKMRNCAVQKHKVEDIIVQFSKNDE